MEKTPQAKKESGKEKSTSIISAIRNKTTKKLMGFLAGLSIASNVEASTANFGKAFDTEPEKSGGPKKEFSEVKRDEARSELTSQYEGNFEKFLEIDFTNYFETDDAGLEGDSRLEIEKEFEDFLQGVNSQTIEDILKSDFVVYSSCDERPSHAFDSNLDLSLARSESIKQVLSETLENFDFSKTDLNEEQIQALKSKEFIFDYPAFPNAEPGVVPLDKEPEIFGEDATRHLTKDELYSLVRMTRFELRIPVSGESGEDMEYTPSVEEEPEIKETFETITKLLKQDATNILLFDKSGSMHNDIDDLAKILEGYDDVKVGSFSNHFDGIADIQNREDIEKVMSGGASTKEHILHSLQEFLNQYSTQMSVYGLNIVMITDEAIQDISLTQIEQIKKEIAEHNIDVSFVLRGGTDIIVSLDDIEQALLENQKYQKEVQSLEKDLESSQLKRDSVKDHDIQEMWEKTIKQFESKLDNMKTKAFTLEIGEFTKEI